MSVCIATQTLQLKLRIQNYKSHTANPFAETITGK
jgi:hypothetical protein